MKMLDSWKIVLWNCILDFDVEQVYLVHYHLILKIKWDMMHFLFVLIGISLPPSNSQNVHHCDCERVCFRGRRTRFSAQRKSIDIFSQHTAANRANRRTLVGKPLSCPSCTRTKLKIAVRRNRMQVRDARNFGGITFAATMAVKA
jgi:hypothetical protein